MEIESDEALTKSWNTLMFNTPQTANKLVDPHLDETDQVARPPMLQSHRPQSQYPRSQSLEEKVKDASFEADRASLGWKGGALGTTNGKRPGWNGRGLSNDRVWEGEQTWLVE